MHCNVIKDLLPLYAEDLVSQESRELIQEHISGCEDCKKELEALKKSPRLPLEVDTTGLKQISNMIRKKRILSVLTAVITLVTVLVTGVIFMMTPIYLTAGQAIEGVKLREDGGLAIDYSRGIMGYGSQMFENGNEEFYLCHTTRYDWLRSKCTTPDFDQMTQQELEDYVQKHRKNEESFQQAHDRILNIHVEYGMWDTSDFCPWCHRPAREEESEQVPKLVCKTAEQNLWYINSRNPYRNAEFWHGAQTETPGIPGDITCVYLCLFIGSLLAALVLLQIAQKSKNHIRKGAFCLGILAASLAVSTIIVTGATFITTNAVASYKWPGMIVCQTITLACTFLAWQSLHQLDQ